MDSIAVCGIELADDAVLKQFIAEYYNTYRHLHRASTHTHTHEKYLATNI